ncbi:MAG: hypothetical protein ACJ0DD_05640 [Paracoccaceae bacterium]
MKKNQKIKYYFKRKKYNNLVQIFAEKSKKIKDLDTACFFATQAYILSLECNNPLSEELLAFLTKNNREY